MAKLSLKAGTTSKSVGIFIQDSSSTVGAGLAALVYNSSNLIAYWWQPGVSAPAAITLVTLSSITASYSSGGFLEADATHCPGDYRLDIPNACLTGATSVIMCLGGAANMAPLRLEIELTVTDNQASPPGVRKNVALANFEFPMVDSSNRPNRKTGATVTATRSIDGAAFGACSNAASENGTTGFYKINLSAADLNGNTIGLLFTASGCDDTYVEILTQP